MATLLRERERNKLSLLLPHLPPSPGRAPRPPLQLSLSLSLKERRRKVVFLHSTLLLPSAQVQGMQRGQVEVAMCQCRLLPYGEGVVLFERKKLSEESLSLPLFHVQRERYIFPKSTTPKRVNLCMVASRCMCSVCMRDGGG